MAEPSLLSRFLGSVGRGLLTPISTIQTLLGIGAPRPVTRTVAAPPRVARRTASFNKFRQTIINFHASGRVREFVTKGIGGLNFTDAEIIKKIRETLNIVLLANPDFALKNVTIVTQTTDEEGVIIEGNQFLSIPRKLIDTFGVSPQGIQQALDLVLEGVRRGADIGITIGSDTFKKQFFDKLIPNFSIWMEKKKSGGCGLKQKKAEIIVGEYTCISVKSKDNNCGIACIKYCSNKNRLKRTRDDLLRKQLKFKDGAMLDFGHMQNVADLFETNLLIYDKDGEIINKPKFVIEGSDTQWDPTRSFQYYEEEGEFCIKQDDAKVNIKLILPYSNTTRIVYHKEHYYVLVDKTAKVKRIVTCGESSSENSSVQTESSSNSSEDYNIDIRSIPQDNPRKKYGDKIRGYVIFDYETIYDNNWDLFPYACAIIMTDAEFNVVEKVFIHTDCHNTFVNGQKVPNPAEDHTKFVNQKVAEYIYNKAPKTADEQGIYLTLGFNNSRFDNYLLAEALIRDGTIPHLFFANNSILEMRCYNFVIHDFCRFVPGSLAEVGKSFGLAAEDQKGSLPHHIIQRHYLKYGDLVNYFKLDYEKIKEYNLQDCVVVLKAYEKFKKVADELGMDVDGSMTISQCAYALWLEKVRLSLPPKMRIKDYLPIVDGTVDKYVRKAMIGGRTQVFNRCMFEGAIVMYDVVSEYPYVMSTRKFPVGKHKTTDKYVKGKLGIYDVTVHKQPKDKILPGRNEDGTLNWEYEGEIKCTTTNVSIKAIWDRCGNDSVTVHSGIYWEYSAFVFKDFIEEAYKLKQHQDSIKGTFDYNAVLRELAKLIMNSVGGKCGQRIFNDVTFLAKSINDIDKHIDNMNEDYQYSSCADCLILKGEKKKPSAPTKPTVLSVFIYEYSRTECLYPAIEGIQNKFICDTDSLAFDKKEEWKFLNIMKGRIHEGGLKTLGDWELEDYCSYVTRGYFIEKKCYGLFDKNGYAVKVRFKGVKRPKDPSDVQSLENLRMGRYKNSPVLDYPGADRIIPVDKMENYINLIRAKRSDELLDWYYGDYNDGDFSFNEEDYEMLLPPALSEDMYKRLLYKDKVYILQSQLTRINQSTSKVFPFGLRQRFLIKDITGDKDKARHKRKSKADSCGDDGPVVEYECLE